MLQLLILMLLMLRRNVPLRLCPNMCQLTLLKALNIENWCVLDVVPMCDAGGRTYCVRDE